MVTGQKLAQERRAIDHDFRDCLRLPRDCTADLASPDATGRRNIEPELESWLLGNLESSGRVIGHGYQAKVRQISSDFGELVVKSPHSNPLLAWFGRRAIQREARVYGQLTGISGIPRCFGLANGEHLVLEYVDGPTLRAAALELKDRHRFFDRLLRSIQAMHAAGVAHGDLKRKENTLVGPDEMPYLIDFGVACCRDNNRTFNRKRFELTRQMDLNAYIKLKYGRLPEQLTDEDAALHRPLLIERLARRARGPWKFLSMRKARKRRRAERSSDAD